MYIRKKMEEMPLLALNRFIHSHGKRLEYHMSHINLTKQYLIVLNNLLSAYVPESKLMKIAYLHDILKERSLNPKEEDMTWNELTIPQDLVKYVRSNLDILKRYQIEDYFNSDIQYHALASGIFTVKELKITDPEILYPIFFHTCPIIDVYKTLPKRIQTIVDMILLADKLSSNSLRIQEGTECNMDLDQIVFGLSGNEFNYSLGLVACRLQRNKKVSHKPNPSIGIDSDTQSHSNITTEFYVKRLLEENPLMSREIVEQMMKQTKGGSKVWPKRRSSVLNMQPKSSRK